MLGIKDMADTFLQTLLATVENRLKLRIVHELSRLFRPYGQNPMIASLPDSRGWVDQSARINLNVQNDDVTPCYISFASGYYLKLSIIHIHPPSALKF